MSIKKAAYNYTQQLPAKLQPLLNAAVGFGTATTLTTNASTSTGYTLTFASTTGAANGAAVVGTGIAANTTIASFTGSTVVLSKGVSSIVASATSITFTPPPVALNTSQPTPDARSLFLTIPANNLGLPTTSVVTATGIPTATTVSSFGPGNKIVISNNVTAALAEGSTITLTPPNVTLSTNATSAISTTILNFAATTGVTNGAAVTGTGVAASSTVVAFSSTQVTLNNPTSGSIANAASITFTGAANLFTLGLSTGLGTTLNFASTTGLSTGNTATGVNIPASTTISSLTSTTAVLSNAVSLGGVGNDELITFTSAKTTIATSAATGTGETLTFASTSGVTPGAEYIESNNNTIIVASTTSTNVVLASSISVSVANGQVLTFHDAGASALPAGMALAWDSAEALDQQHFLVYAHVYNTNGVPGSTMQALPTSFATSLATAITAADTSNTYTWTLNSVASNKTLYDLCFNVYSKTALSIA